MRPCRASASLILFFALGSIPGSGVSLAACVKRAADGRAERALYQLFESVSFWAQKTSRNRRRRRRKTPGTPRTPRARREAKRSAPQRRKHEVLFQKRKREDTPGRERDASRARAERHAGTGGFNFQRARARAGREDARKRTAPKARGRGGTVERGRRATKTRRGRHADRDDRLTNAEPQQSRQEHNRAERRRGADGRERHLRMQTRTRARSKRATALSS